jgi:DNA-directed RNA polymerase I subunit RPA2
VDEKSLQRLEHLVSAHVDSFNYFLESGLRAAVSDLLPIEFSLGDESLFVRAFVTQMNLGAPSKADDFAEAKMTPREARERQLTYAGAMSCNMQVQVMIGDSIVNDHSFTVKLGQMPIMVMSNKCHLRGYNPRRLAQAGEEATEVGGYFILNGIERVIRLLQVPRRNHALAIERSSYKNRGPLYSDKGVAMRCVRPDQSSITVTLHYLNNGGATVKFVLRKQEFLIPVVIVARALCDVTDKELSERVLLGDVSNTFVSTRMELLLRDAKQYGLESQRACLSYLGFHFRAFLPISSRTSDEEAGRLLVQRYLFVHVDEFNAKFECLLHLLRKLFSFAQGKCAADNADVFMNHELLLPGHLTTMVRLTAIVAVVVSVLLYPSSLTA